MSDPRPAPWRIALFGWLLPVAILAGGLLLARHLVLTAPEPPRKPKDRLATLVEVHVAVREPREVVVESMGEVMPAREIELEPRVSGRIDRIAAELIPGAHFSQGEFLFGIERRDYELAIVGRESDVTVARAAISAAERQLATALRDLELEKGSRTVALRDFELLGEIVDDETRDLVLREPQLRAREAEVTAARAGIDSARAALEGAESRLEAARLDLARTDITVPFDAVLEEKRAEIGDTVSATTVLARLVGAGEFWVELSVPRDLLRWIREPGDGRPGSAVRFHDRAGWGEGVHRTGEVLRVLPSVDPRGRMARVLATVRDPLGLDDESGGIPRVLIGTSVRAEIIGERVTPLAVLPRRLLRGDDRVWVLAPDGRLEVRTIEILHAGREDVLVARGLAAGERVVATDLSAPVEGMRLRTADDPVPPVAPVSSTNGAAGGGPR